MKKSFYENKFKIEIKPLLIMNFLKRAHNKIKQMNLNSLNKIIKNLK